MGDPRFKDLLRDLGLVDYFRASGKLGGFLQARRQGRF
jgi:hypothetical protein